MQKHPTAAVVIITQCGLLKKLSLSQIQNHTMILKVVIGPNFKHRVVKKEKRVTVVSVELQVQMGNKDKWVLEVCKGYKVLKANKVCKVRLDLKEYKVQLVLMAKTANAASKATRVIKEIKVLLVFKGARVIQAYKDQEVIEVIKVTKEIKEILE